MLRPSLTFTLHCCSSPNSFEALFAIWQNSFFPFNLVFNMSEINYLSLFCILKTSASCSANWLSLYLEIHKAVIYNDISVRSLTFFLDFGSLNLCWSLSDVLSSSCISQRPVTQVNNVATLRAMYWWCVVILKFLQFQTKTLKVFFRAQLL